ncbi:Uncharacterised protein [Acinetobacter baumannii]|uniref:hypothetical protein n=1 Tax=Acinetobacter baumannii TaxID=470 RepID=UPI000707B4AD|nr:hypothetical protein [Acinetobacter baumannii]EHU2215494.1 hypothetical protein [Acinetobacter baumannii]KQD43436.1 hypothetical protein APD15_07505 [Acinetobacter baumannii]SSR81238.1 Uncharacterised protein [Acinetobacter baumannii]HCA4905789.1 hypothetical protein [Acinetobacter baumannii]
MDKCREEFEQNPKTKELLSDSIYFDEKENRYKVNADGCLISVVFLNGRWEVWQEQQAKVEELQKQLSEYIFVAETIDEMYVKEVQKSDELQKRVDKAIRFLVEAELYQSEPNIDLAVKALKGEG